MPEVITDTSPLQYLFQLGRLNLLPDFFAARFRCLPMSSWKSTPASGNRLPEVLQLHAAGDYQVAVSVISSPAGEGDGPFLGAELPSDWSREAQ